MRCDELKLLADMTADKRNEHGVAALCKACVSEYGRGYRAANADNPEYRKRTREYGRRYREANADNPEFRERAREHNRRYREANRDNPEFRERTREQARRYHDANRDNPEFRERWRERARLYREANRDNPEYRERIRAHSRRYHEANAARTDAEVLADRARLRPDGLKKCRVGHIAPFDEFGDNRTKADGLRDLCRAHDTMLLKHAIDRWEELDLWRCIYCDAPFEDIEHSIPRSRAAEFGLDDPDDINNLVPSCAACNRGPGGKHAQTPAEWRPVEHAAMREVVSRLRAAE